MKRFSIDFKGTFLVCVGIMVLDKIMIALNSLPPLFPGADVLYQFSASGISIAAQLAVSVAAAIIFYYCMEFYNVKRNIEKYIDLRKDLLFILYAHMALVRHTSEFDALNQRKRLVDDDVFFDMNDIPYLLSDYEKWNKDNSKIVYELTSFYKTLSPHLQAFYISRFKKEMDSLKEKRNYRYIKGSSDDIDNILSTYQEMIEYYEAWKKQKDTESKDQLLIDIFNDYIDFLDYSVKFYRLVEQFIKCIDEKRIILYLKMLY